MLRLKLLPWAAATAIGLGSTGAHAAFTITLEFGTIDAAYKPYFEEAKSFWEGVITGYRESVGLTGVTITASIKTDDGSGGTLGQAGPTAGGVFGNFSLATAGTMAFDIADVPELVNDGFFDDVIRHEMAHVLGFGTLWTNNGVYVSNSGQYKGSFALATYQAEYNQPDADWVPVELEGGSGTANGHWNEANNGGASTGIVDGQGRDMKFELMTGWLNVPTYTSRTTAASFYDIGYTVNLSAVPEPAALALWLLGVPLLAGVAARRRNKA
jgi:hypothetical protein